MVPDFQSLPKSELYATLKSSVNFDRVRRMEARAEAKDKTSSASTLDLPFSSSRDFAYSSASSSSSKSKPSSKSSSTLSSSSLLGKRPAENDALTNTKCSSNSSILAKKHGTMNKFDPIMFTPLRKKAIWKFVRPNGGVVAFNVDSLADFMLSTGDFHDPETRIPFSDAELMEIDAVIVKSKFSKASVLAAKQNPQTYADAKFRRDAIQGLERCAGECIADILDIIETSDPQEAQMRILMRELPMFGDYYSQLRSADPSFAAQSLSHWKQFLLGPPNKPNPDVYGLIECVHNFLCVCAENNFEGLIGTGPGYD